MGIIKLPSRSKKFYEDNVDEIFNSGNLAEGMWNKRLSEWCCEYTGANYGLAVNSNGSGIFLLLRLFKEYRKKKRIFLQSNTMYGVRTIAITSGLELCGYVDCELDYLMPTYEKVVEFVSCLEKPEETVFLITHIGGWVNPDIKKIATYCKSMGVALIEDCAHSLGSLLKNEHTGLFGDAGVYSLYATKAVPAGEGGLLVTDDKELSELANKFVIYDRFDQEIDIGINFRLSEISALLCYSVVKETEEIITQKYEISSLYLDSCKKYGWNYINPVANNQRANLYKFILLSRSENPAEEFEQLKTRTSQVYDYALGRDRREITKRHVCLPVWYKLEKDQITSVLTELSR